MSPRQTALARLLQERREAAGYSRTRIGELIGIKPGTIEGWELGRVGKPPIHDVLRFARFLRISPEEIEQAVFEDAGEVPAPEDLPAGKERKKAGRRAEASPTPLLEAAFKLLGWKDDSAAASALGMSEERFRAIRAGRERMDYSEYIGLSSMVSVAAADALGGGKARSEDLAAAAEALGVRHHSGQR